MKLRIGILIHHNKIWLSELLTIVFVSILVAALFSITFLVLRNELLMRSNDRRISELQAENMVLSYTLNDVREKDRIASILCSFAGKRVRPEAVYKLAEVVYASGKQFGYDPMLLLSVIQTESSFDHRALGKYRSGELSGALGLMQLKEETARQVAKNLGIVELKREDLFKPEVNLVLGVAYLAQLVSRFKSFKLGLLAYNHGPGVVIEKLSKKETLPIKYYQRVLSAYYELQRHAAADTLRGARRACW